MLFARITLEKFHFFEVTLPSNSNSSRNAHSAMTVLSLLHKPLEALPLNAMEAPYPHKRIKYTQKT